MPVKQIAVIIGSLRKESFNRKMAKALIALAPSTLRLDIVEIGDLPMYNQDIDDNPPAAWKQLRDTVRGYDGVLFLTPEYNRSVPPVLKNALDICSRPYGQSAWSGKPCAVVSVSPGALGGFGANHHLRQSLVCLNMPALAQPEAYIGNAARLFDDSGALVDEPAMDFGRKFMQAFAAWVATNAK